MTETTSETTFDVCQVEELPPGEKRIVDAAGRKIGIFNAGGELYAI
jgi:nitrite reductase/ring-hydroxylating ferredoxin subunit